MQSSGIIRRVDELGRIVIPVEIRKLLNIKVGENLEFILNNNYIELKKRSLVENKSEFINLISNKLSEVVDGDFFITNREKVICSSNHDIENKIIDGKLIDLLSNHDDSSYINDELSFIDIDLKGSFYIFPYYISSDIAGFIVLYNISSVDKYQKLMKFITYFIQDKLSI